jgi:trehalose-phosphatase
MRHLFDSWATVAQRLKTARSVALFLDFDGTLARIVDHPSRAVLPAQTRRQLERLAGRRAIRLCVISGRDYRSLRSVVGIPGVRCLGLYGWENGNGLRLDGSARQALSSAKRDLAARIDGLSGIWIEEKRYAFAVHYRDAPKCAVRRARAGLHSVLQPYGGTLGLVRAKMAWDVLPVSIRGKGAAVLRELQAHPADLAIYAGDDGADECAFRAIAGGISIHVGARGRSRAEFRLRDPGEVRRFLEKLENELP